MAVVTPVKEDVKAEVVEKEMTKKESREMKKQERKAERLEKRMAKFEKKMEKRSARGRDDTSKWMKFWLIGWGLALVLPYIAIALVGTTAGSFGFAGVLLLLSGLAFIFGTVSLIVWLLKKAS